jgi:hypothetical protein
MIKYIEKEANFTERETLTYMLAYEFSDYELIRKLKWIKFNCKLKSVAYIRNYSSINIYLLQNSTDIDLIIWWIKKAFDEETEFITRTRQNYLDKELNS